MCKISLVDKPFGSKNDRIFCANCYDQAFATRCDGCNEIFKAGKYLYVQVISSYCKTEAFARRKIWRLRFVRYSMVVCGHNFFIPKRARPFHLECTFLKFKFAYSRLGMKKMEYKGKQWHDKCFCCALCKSPIGTKSFIPKNDEVYCASCYEEKFATRCTKCRKVNCLPSIFMSQTRNIK